MCNTEIGSCLQRGGREREKKKRRRREKKGLHGFVEERKNKKSNATYKLGIIDNKKERALPLKKKKKRNWLYW